MKSQSGLKLRGGINIVSIFTPMSYIKGCGGGEVGVLNFLNGS